MIKRLYSKWMYNWETRLTTRDENRIVRPVEWGFDWVQQTLDRAGIMASESMPKEEALAVFDKLNHWIITNAEEFFGYERPTDYRLEARFPQLFPTNVRPETLAQDEALRKKAESGALPKAQFLRFTSPERTPYPENDLVNARWYPAPEHKDPKRPKQAIIILPQWNADAFSHNALAGIFNKMGISALRLSKPYHDIRRPAELERADYAVSSNIGRTISACRQAVVDIRCCLDWLETQGYEHFGVLGTSLGSCYAYLASTMDPRIQVNAFNHASTAFGDVVWTGQSTRHIRQALEDAGMKAEELRGTWAGISPMNYYKRYAECGLPDKKKKTLLIYAQYDLTFPLQYSLEVKRAFTEFGYDFECRVLPCGHYTTGETPYKYIDGWYLGSFVYRAFKQLRNG
jgi:dienelactone hydrolase